MQFELILMSQHIFTSCFVDCIFTLVIILLLTNPRGYAIQHIPVPVPSQDKLGGLRQMGD